MGERLVLRNCPFHRLATEHEDVVCPMSLAFVEGVVDRLGCRDFEPTLEPEPPLCCVKVRPRRSPEAPAAGDPG